MDIRVIKRQGNAYVAMEKTGTSNGWRKVRTFDAGFEAIIVGGGSDFGGVYFDESRKLPVCWSQTLRIPGPPVNASSPKSDTCIKLHPENGEPVLHQGKIMAKCPLYGNGCIPSFGLCIVVPELGPYLWNFTIVGDEVTGKSDFENGLYSFMGYYKKLLNAAGAMDDAAKFKIQITFSANKQQTFIKIPADTDLHPDPEEALRQYEAITKIYQNAVSGNNHLLLTSVDPRLWATVSHPKSVQKQIEKKSKVKKKPGRKGMSRKAYLTMALKRKDLKPKTREKFETELAGIKGEEE